MIKQKEFSPIEQAEKYASRWFDEAMINLVNALKSGHYGRIAEAKASCNEAKLALQELDKKAPVSKFAIRPLGTTKLDALNEARKKELDIK